MQLRCVLHGLIRDPSVSQEEGLKLTFSKQALMPNGSGGESSSRKRRKDQEVLGLHVSFGSTDTLECNNKTTVDLFF